MEESYINKKSEESFQAYVYGDHTPIYSARLTLPVNVSVHGLIPASRLEVPKSDILTTPL